MLGLGITVAVPCPGGACAIGDGCVRGFLMYSDGDMVGMPMAWYFRKAFEKVFMAPRCSLLVCMCYSLRQSEFIFRYDFNNIW